MTPADKRIADRKGREIWVFDGIKPKCVVIVFGMNSFQRGIIETRVQEMEAGRFQEFMLRFLPIYDSKYTGIIRHGHTEFGKTRPGTPDLIHIHENGDQIGCECSTSEDYWLPPIDPSNYPTWKPIEDAEKSIKNLVRPVEIILASNRPIPTKHPNVKTLIIDHLSKLHKCAIKFFTSADISSWIAINLQRKEVIEIAFEFFPEVAENIKLKQEKDTLQSAINHADRLGFPTTKKIVEILKVSGISGAEAIEEQVVTEIFGDDRRFTFEIPESLSGIMRCKDRLPVLLQPLGKIIQLIGVPKIGKTYLCQEAIRTNHFQYKWFSVPLDERQLPEFLDALQITLFSNFWPHKEVFRYVRGQSKGTLDPSKVKTNTLQVLVIDNAHLLSENQMQVIDQAFRFLKSKFLLKSIGIILITNKKLDSSIRSIDITTVAPVWSDSEISEFIKSRNIQISDPDPVEYYELLASQSGGHPLFAAALAEQYPNRATLIFNAISAPGAQDSDLSNEIKTVLYKDILTSTDKQNFIQRLSVLTEKSELSVLDSLRINVSPQISTTVPNLLADIGPAVIEGTVNDGLRVNPTFREIAKKLITADESRQVYRVAATVLLKVKDKTIHVERFTQGIFYLLMAGQIGQAAFQALFLLNGVQKSDSKNKYLKIVLDRLSYFKMIQKGFNKFDLIPLYLLKIMMGHYHSSLHEYEEAVGFLQGVNIQEIEKIGDGDSDITEMKQYLKLAALGGKILILNYCSDPVSEIIQFLEGISKIPDQPIVAEMIEILPDIISNLPDEKLINSDLTNLSSRLYEGHPEVLANVALRIGCKASKNLEIWKAIQKINKADKPSNFLFKTLSDSSLRLQNGTYEEALELTLAAKEIIKKDGKEPDFLGSVFFQHYGDILYNLGRMGEAITAYARSIKLEQEGNDFILGWNKWKIGLSSESDLEIEENLSAAIEHFLKVQDYRQASRAKGALAAYFIKKKNFNKVLEIGSDLAKLYYNDKRFEVGPALRLLGAQILRVVSELEGQPIPQPQENYPEANPQTYLTVLDSARPEAGAGVVFNILARLAKAAGYPEQEKEILKKGIYSEIEGEVDRGALALNWYNLFKILNPSEVNEDELILLLKRMVQYQPSPNSKNENFFLFSIFKPFEEKAKGNPKLWAPILLMVTEAAQKLVNELDKSLEDPWQAYINFEAGLAKYLIESKSQAYSLLRRATQSAILHSNWNLGKESGFLAAFNLWECHPSFLEAGKAQYELFQCIESSGGSKDELKNLGINMFRYWSSVNWTRLSESDLKLKKLLFDSAKTLKASEFSEEEAAPIMCALLAKAFNSSSNQNHQANFIKTPPQEIVALLENQI